MLRFPTVLTVITSTASNGRFLVTNAALPGVSGAGILFNRGLLASRTGVVRARNGTLHSVFSNCEPCQA